MKKCAILFVVFTILGCARAGIVLKEYKPEHIIHYGNLHTLERAASLSNYVVYLDKGDTFPLEVFCDTDIIGINNDKVDVVAKRRLFFMLRMPEDVSEEELAELERMNKEALSKMSAPDRRDFFSKFMLYVSKDAKAWAPINDIRLIKEAFGSKGGTFSFGMGLSDEEGIWSRFSVREVR